MYRPEKKAWRRNMKKNTDLEIGVRFSSVRVGEGLSQAAFASSLDISTRTCAHIEAGTRPPSAETILSLHQVYNIQPNWILLGVGVPEVGEDSKALHEFLDDLDKYIEENNASITYQAKNKLIAKWHETLRTARQPLTHEFSFLLKLVQE